MRIGELAKRANVSTSRIRFYEKIGLLQMVTRETNGYRRYPEEALVLLQLITNGQRAGFSLDELKALLPKDLNHWHHEVLEQAIENKLADIKAMEQTLANNKQKLLTILAAMADKPDDIDCKRNAMRVIAAMKQTQ